jgi:hypothetical protein
MLNWRINTMPAERPSRADLRATCAERQRPSGQVHEGPLPIEARLLDRFLREELLVLFDAGSEPVGTKERWQDRGCDSPDEEKSP